MRLLIASFLTVLLTFSVFAQSNKRGKPQAQTFTVTSLEQKKFDLAEMKGKVVLLTFWSTRCPICASEIPKLNQIAASYKNKDVVFLGLSAENESKIKSHLKKKPFDFNIIPNSFDMVLKYADKDRDGNVAMGYPAYYLINQKGEIELKTNGYDKTVTIDKQINQLLTTK